MSNLMSNTISIAVDEFEYKKMNFIFNALNDGWSISKLEGMWKGISEDSVELQIVCNVDKSKEIVYIILSKAKELNQDSIMVGNTFISCK